MYVYSVVLEFCLDISNKKRSQAISDPSEHVEYFVTRQRTSYYPCISFHCAFPLNQMTTYSISPKSLFPNLLLLSLLTSGH